MNKYQEAFYKIRKSRGEPTEERLPNECDLIQELVDKAPYHKELEDKATPKKPIVLSYSESPSVEKIISCDCCKKPIINVWSYKTYKPNCCHYCGQSLDWSTDDNSI